MSQPTSDDTLPGEMNIESRQLDLETEVVHEGMHLVVHATSPRARTVAAYTLIMSLEAFGVAELGAPVAASLAVLEGQERPDSVLLGALTLSGNAILHRALKLGRISYQTVEGRRDEFQFKADGVPFVCSWLVFRAVSALVNDPGPRALERSAFQLRDALGLLGPYPDVAAKMVTFFRSVEIDRIASEDSPEPIGSG